MSKAITKILGATRKASFSGEPVKHEAHGGNDSVRKAGASELDARIVKNIPVASSARDVGRFLSLGDVEMADVALHTAYVENIRQEKAREAAAAVTNYETDPKHEFLRNLVQEYADLKAEVQYVREERHGVPLSHARSKSVDPVAFMGTLYREGVQNNPTEYHLDMKNDFVGGNWYDVEGADGHYWRWSGPSNSSTIILPSLGGGNLRFALKFRSVHHDSKHDLGLKIYVDGGEVHLGDYHVQDGSMELSFVTCVDESDAHDKIVLRIEVDRTHSPKELRGENDSRKLGIVLFECAMFRSDLNGN